MSHSTNFSRKARQVTEVPMTQAELTAAQTAGELPPSGTPIVIVDNAGAFVGRKESTGASSQPTSGGGAGTGSVPTNWTASTALDAGKIILATVAVGGFAVGEQIYPSTAITTGATFNSTEAGRFLSVPEDTTIIKKSDVVNTLVGTDTDKPLSALQGKTLKDTADTLATTVGTKAPTASPTFTGTVSGVTKAMVGLANAENTTDLLKPVSTATQSALDLKAPIASPTFTGVPAVPTPAVDTNTTQAINAVWVNSQLSGTLPLMNGTATVGSGTRSVRGNHVHPSDTSREATANKNAANGYAGLDATSKIAIAQLPSLATTTTTSIAPILGANIGLPGYRRSKLIPVSSTTTGSGDYQVEIAVGESALSVGATFHLAGNSQDFPTAQKDSGEFAFVKPDGIAIPFFVAEVTGTAPNRTARIYLRMPGLTGQATTVQSLVFMLYDNNLMTIPSQMSPIASVFNLLADDFDGAIIDAGLWTSTGITTTPSASVLTFGGGNTARLLDSIATFGDNTEILSRFTFTTTNASTSQFGYRSAVTADTYAVGDVWDTNTSVWVGATRTDLTTGPDATSRLYRLRRNAGAGVFTWHNGTSQITQNSTSVPTVATPVRGWNTYDNSTSIDWVAVRQTLAVPPTVGAVSEV